MRVRGSPLYCKNDERAKMSLSLLDGKTAQEDEFKPGDQPVCFFGVRFFGGGKSGFFGYIPGVIKTSSPAGEDVFLPKETRLIVNTGPWPKGERE